MGVAERKGRQRTECEHRIPAAARLIAASEGWRKVTIPRLARVIGYSQPVLYSHFGNRDASAAAVAVERFAKLAIALRQAAQGSTDRRSSVQNVAVAYLAFAREHRTLHEALFTMPTGLRSAQANTKSELKDALAAPAAVVMPLNGDVKTATETFSAALHGLAALERSGRIRPSARDERMALLVDGLLRY